MDIIDFPATCSDMPQLTAALGFFDGVHLGHRKIIEKAVSIAKSSGTCPAVVTFRSEDPGIKSSSPRITDTERKLEIFDSLGVERVIFLPFSEVSSLTPESFVKDILTDTLSVKTAVCGFNYRFGKDATGDSRMLERLMMDEGERAVVCDEVIVGGTPVSSSLIRELLEDGAVDSAAKLLGDNYTVILPVVHGKQLGRRIGFPTVNQIQPDGMVKLKNGVYATRVTFNGKSYRGVTNAGLRPTVENTVKANLETYIEDFSENIYGETVRIEFLKFIRPEIRFPGVQDLIKQIKLDVSEVSKGEL